VSEVLDASTGSTAAHYEYDAFGNVITPLTGAASANPWRFSTKYVDGESGYSYYGFRYYWSEAGRWTRRDPSGERSGANLNAFIANSPTDRTDYLGLKIACRGPCVDQILRKYGVTGWKRRYQNGVHVYSGSPRYTVGGPYAPFDSSASEILGTMIKSFRTFKVDGANGLMEHVRARHGIVVETRTKEFGFSSPAEERDRRLWMCVPVDPREPAGECRWTIRPGVNEVDAARSLRGPDGARQSVGCQTAALFTMCAGAGVGASGLRFSDKVWLSDPFIPGEQAYLRNTGASRVFSGLEGENLIYVGGGLFWGHLDRTNRYLPLRTSDALTSNPDANHTPADGNSWFDLIHARFGEKPTLTTERTWPTVGLLE
jgi:RHS repeat-associated protein